MNAPTGDRCVVRWIYDLHSLALICPKNTVRLKLFPVELHKSVPRCSSLMEDCLEDEECIRLSAKVMVRAHNGSAALMCAQNAEKWKRRGDYSAGDLWLRILQAVRQLEHEMVRG